MNFSFWPFLWLGLPGQLLIEDQKKKKPRVRKLLFCNSGAGKWLRQFYARLEFLLSFCRKTSMSIKFLVLGGGILGYFTFMGAGIFLRRDALFQRRRPGQLEWRHLLCRGAPKSFKNKKDILRTSPLVRNFPLSGSKLLRMFFWQLDRQGVFVHPLRITVTQLLNLDAPPSKFRR